LREIPHPVPVCADESAHSQDDLWRLRELYDCINIKLDKTGGLTAGLAMQGMARSLGFSVMVGCMVGTSLSMAPAILLAQDAEYADLDGPLILAKDREHGLRYSDGKVFPPAARLWG
jgi:L-alanine-DL-glutamate epimerase-like enolase superfamily enzyme